MLFDNLSSCKTCSLTISTLLVHLFKLSTKFIGYQAKRQKFDIHRNSVVFTKTAPRESKYNTDPFWFGGEINYRVYSLTSSTAPYQTTATKKQQKKYLT